MIEQSIIDNKKNHTPIETIKYILHFLTRSFLIAVLILFIVLIMCVILYFCDSLYNIKKGNNKTPLFGAYVIVSQSMIPTIKVNDAIVIKRADSNELEIGDIITFSSRSSSYFGLTVTHRIVGKQQSQSGDYVYRTKGDNNNSEDSTLVQNGDIYGKVILKIPKIGYIQKFVSTPSGFIISILIPTSFVVIYDVIRIILLLKKRKEEKLGII